MGCLYKTKKGKSRGLKPDEVCSNAVGTFFKVFNNDGIVAGASRWGIDCIPMSALEILILSSAVSAGTSLMIRLGFNF